MTDAKPLKYPLNIWLYTVLSSPMLFFIFLKSYSFSNFKEFLDFLPSIFPITFLGALVSLPALFFYCLVYLRIQKLPFSIWVIKLLTTLSGIFFIFGTLYFFTVLVFRETPLLSDIVFQALAGSYCLSLCIYSLVFKPSFSEQRTVHNKF